MKLPKNLTVIISCTAILINFFVSTKSFAEPLSVKQDAITSAETNALADIATIDKNEILLAVIASNKKTSPEVMDFAKMMIEQHGSNLSQLIEIASSLQVQSLSSNESDKLAAQGNKEMMTLGRLQGDQFDNAYIDAMIKGHQAALDLIDNQLMKTTKTEMVNSFLKDTRTAVMQHLDKAKTLQKKPEVLK